MYEVIAPTELLRHEKNNTLYGSNRVYDFHY